LFDSGALRSGRTLCPLHPTDQSFLHFSFPDLFSFPFAITRRDSFNAPVCAVEEALRASYSSVSPSVRGVSGEPLSLYRSFNCPTLLLRRDPLQDRQSTLNFFALWCSVFCPPPIHVRQYTSISLLPVYKDCLPFHRALHRRTTLFRTAVRRAGIPLFWKDPRSQQPMFAHLFFFLIMKFPVFTASRSGIACVFPTPPRRSISPVLV